MKLRYVLVLLVAAVAVGAAVVYVIDREPARPFVQSPPAQPAATPHDSGNL